MASGFNENIDYYSLLGVPNTSTIDEIKKAYRKKALECHPDKNDDKEKANKKFLTIRRAYEVLTNPSSKERYDINLRRNKQKCKEEYERQERNKREKERREKQEREKQEKEKRDRERQQKESSAEDTKNLTIGQMRARVEARFRDEMIKKLDATFATGLAPLTPLLDLGVSPRQDRQTQEKEKQKEGRQNVGRDTELSREFEGIRLEPLQPLQPLPRFQW